MSIITTRAGKGALLTSAEVDANLTGLNSFKVEKTSDTGSALLPSGTTAQRDGVPVFGATRANSTLNQTEWWNGAAWVQDAAAADVAFKANAGANTDITSLSGLTTALSIAQGGTGAATANTAADAMGAFRRGTILGAVSQAAGIPTGAIIEVITNANGKAVRFADGTQICTRVFATGVLTWTAATNLYFASVADIVFASGFIATPALTVQSFDGDISSRSCYVSSAAPTTTGTGSVFLTNWRNAAPGTTGVTLNIAAVGRWF